MADLCPCCYRPLPPEFDLTVSLNENCVIWMGIRCDLTPMETEIVYALKESGRKFLAKERILTRVHGIMEGPTEKVVSVHMSHIRRKLRDKQIPVTVENRWSQGYRLKYG